MNDLIGNFNRRNKIFVNTRIVEINNKPQVKFCIGYGKNVRPKESIPNLVERISDGNSYFETYHDFIKGYLTDVYITEHEFEGKKSKKLNIVLSSNDTDVVYGAYLGSDYSTSFLKRVGNIDIKKPLTLSPFLFKDKERGKDVRGLVLYHGKEKIASLYTKENPNGIPQWEQIEVKGELTWDNSKEIKFLLGKLDEFKVKLMAERVIDISGGVDLEGEISGSENLEEDLGAYQSQEENLFGGDDNEDLKF